MSLTETMTALETMTLPERFSAAEKLATGNGWSFILFALIDREDTPGQWDLVVSANWAHSDREGIAHIIKVLSATNLTTVDWFLISRIVPLNPSDEFVQMVARLYPAEHELRAISAGTLGDTRINRAVIITAKLLPEEVGAAPERGGREIPRHSLPRG